MKFEVCNAQGKVIMSTEHESCVPYEYLDSMVRGGYRFKVNGKYVVKNNVRKAIAESLGNPATVSSVSSNAPSSIPDMPAEHISSTVTSKSVRCIETGKIYKNQAEAARDLNIDPAQVSDSIKSGRPRSGYRFERVL